MPRGAKFDLKWYGSDFEKQLKGNMAARMEDAAKTLQEDIRANISTPAPPHSRPGEYPHLVSGALKKSIEYSMDADGQGFSIGTKLKYGLFHEFVSGRSFLRRTLAESRRKLARILLRPMTATERVSHVGKAAGGLFSRAASAVSNAAASVGRAVKGLFSRMIGR